MQCANDGRNQLRNLIASMTLPGERKIAQTDRDIQWLGRNVAIQNSSHPNIEDVRTLLRDLGARVVL